MSPRRLLPALIAFVALVVFAPSASAAGHGKRAAVRSFSGTVAKTAPRRHLLTLKTGSRRSVKLRVGRATRGARLARLRTGQKVVVRAVRGRHGWTAARITLAKVSATDETGDDDDPVDDGDDPGDEDGVSGDDEGADDNGGDTASDDDQSADDGSGDDDAGDDS